MSLLKGFKQVRQYITVRCLVTGAFNMVAAYILVRYTNNYLLIATFSSVYPLKTCIGLKAHYIGKLVFKKIGIW